jgi:hypothetical protein
VGGIEGFRERENWRSRERIKIKCFVLIVFSCSKLMWHSFIGGQKTLIVCHDRTEVKLLL